MGATPNEYVNPSSATEDVTECQFNTSCSPESPLHLSPENFHSQMYIPLHKNHFEESQAFLPLEQFLSFHLSKNQRLSTKTSGARNRPTGVSCSGRPIFRAFQKPSMSGSGYPKPKLMCQKTSNLDLKMDLTNTKSDQFCSPFRPFRTENSSHNINASWTLNL